MSDTNGIMDAPNDVTSIPTGGKHSRAISEAFEALRLVNLTGKSDCESKGTQ